MKYMGNKIKNTETIPRRRITNYIGEIHKNPIWRAWNRSLDILKTSSLSYWRVVGDMSNDKMHGDSND